MLLGTACCPARRKHAVTKMIAQVNGMRPVRGGPTAARLVRLTRRSAAFRMNEEVLNRRPRYLRREVTRSRPLLFMNACARLVRLPACSICRLNTNATSATHTPRRRDAACEKGRCRRPLRKVTRGTRGHLHSSRSSICASRSRPFGPLRTREIASPPGTPAP